MPWVRTTLWCALAVLGGCDRNTSPRDPARRPRGDDALPGASRAPDRQTDERSRSARPRRSGRRVDIASDALCVTKGKLGRSRIEVPTFRAVAPGNASDVMEVEMLVRGRTSEGRALASGRERRQIGLKLRAQDGCNVVYVMWRLDPAPKLEVSVKRNPGQRTSAECGTRGYTKVAPAHTSPLPELAGHEHSLRAEIVGDWLTAWVDSEIVWQGMLPPEAADLVGPPGLRTDNLDVEIVKLSTEAVDDTDEVDVKCVDRHSD